MADIEPKRKSRLSRLLGAGSRKREEDMSQQERVDANSPFDSAYGSDLGAPSKADIEAFDNHGQIPGVPADRPLVRDKKTGEVVDEESGDVVITTVTTTTTTTRMRGGKAVEVTSTTGPPEPSIKQRPSEAPNDEQLAPQQTYQHNQIPNAKSMNVPGPAELSTDGQLLNSEVSPVLPSRDSPPLPTRNPNRSTPSPRLVPDHDITSPVSPVEPRHSGFGHRESVASNNSRVSGSFNNLKAAAIGLHGVGETLRGTLNDAVDRRLPRSDSEKAAVVNARNQEAIERGRREMAGLNSFRKDRTA
ncbi:Hypothetical protein R9X50_00703400 [Acrodontium crateriforme]|uniref:Uncharacterized protein n=1 Tax=Acrodontium crateriforme TaxID=150365 RepID=A0AAQ3MBW4_9PEZI|nr:Hypothetical protein R9X50_00703400 [Acrodontium crateriforme]